MAVKALQLELDQKKAELEKHEELLQQKLAEQRQKYEQQIRKLEIHVSEEKRRFSDQEKELRMSRDRINQLHQQINLNQMETNAMRRTLEGRLNETQQKYDQLNNEFQMEIQRNNISWEKSIQTREETLIQKAKKLQAELDLQILNFQKMDQEHSQRYKLMKIDNERLQRLVTEFERK